MGDWAVVVCNNLDSDIEVILCDTYENACRYLEDEWTDHMQAEMTENYPCLEVNRSFQKKEYAQIMWKNNDTPIKTWKVVKTGRPPTRYL